MAVQRYFDGKLRGEYRYDTQGNEVEYTEYDRDSNPRGIYVTGSDGEKRVTTAVWNGIMTLEPISGEPNMSMGWQLRFPLFKE